MNLSKRATGFVAGAGCLLLITAVSVASDTFVYLSDITWLMAPSSGVADRVAYTDESGEVVNTALKIAGQTYQKGIFAVCSWRSPTRFVYMTNRKYSRLSGVAGISDATRADWFEWCCKEKITDDSTHIKCICRPDSYGGSEDNTYIRVGAGASVQVYGYINGQSSLIYESNEFYAWSNQPEPIDVDISQCEKIVINFNPEHTEQPAAPYRKGSPMVPLNVGFVPWADRVILADAKLHVADLQTSVSMSSRRGARSAPRFRKVVVGLSAHKPHASSAIGYVTIRGERIAAPSTATGEAAPALVLQY